MGPIRRFQSERVGPAAAFDGHDQENKTRGSIRAAAQDPHRDRADSDTGNEKALRRERAAYELPRLKVDHAAIDWDNLSVVRHETALAKLPLVIDYIAEMLEGGIRKVVVFAHHRDMIARLTEGLVQFNPVILIGGMGPKERQASIDVFHNDPRVRVFLGNLQAAGMGITLAPASSDCVFAEMSWVPAEMTQAEDRLHRIGTRDCVTVHHLVLEGSLDAMMVRVLIKKQQILDAVLWMVRSCREY